MEPSARLLSKRLKGSILAIPSAMFNLAVPVHNVPPVLSLVPCWLPFSSKEALQAAVVLPSSPPKVNNISSAGTGANQGKGSPPAPLKVPTRTYHPFHALRRRSTAARVTCSPTLAAHEPAARWL
jgi:hypothetical protein